MNDLPPELSSLPFGEREWDDSILSYVYRCEISDSLELLFWPNYHTGMVFDIDIINYRYYLEFTYEDCIKITNQMFKLSADLKSAYLLAYELGLLRMLQ